MSAVPVAVLAVAARPCTIHSVTAEQWLNSESVLLEPVLVDVGTPNATLEALDHLMVRVMSARSADSMVYSQFGRGSTPATTAQFGSFVAAGAADDMVFSLADDGEEATVQAVEALVPPAVATRAGTALEQASHSAAAMCGGSGNADYGSCHADEAAQWRAWSTSLISAGGRHAGLRLHQHGAAWLYLLAGMKQWWLAHPE